MHGKDIIVEINQDRGSSAVWYVNEQYTLKCLSRTVTGTIIINYASDDNHLEISVERSYLFNS